MVTDSDDADSANDIGGADDLLSPMEATDSDDVLNADGDEVVDPPDDWSGADQFGMSAEEQREGETLDQRLAEEEPDIVPEVVDSGDADSPAGDDAVIEGSDVAEAASGVHHGQIDDAPEDGQSLFPLVEDVTRRSDEP